MFLSDFNNFEKLMPEQVVNWTSTTNSCSFTIKGMADLAMKIGDTEANRFISYTSDGDSPFPFHLDFNLSETDGSSCDVTAVLHAQLNTMLKMMASRPLQNFVNLLAGKLREVMESR